MTPLIAVRIDMISRTVYLTYHPVFEVDVP
jgi:hypothetical protein